MNFLAHLALSGDSQMVLMGNYVADFVKGKVTEERLQTWPDGFGKGILLHRTIDHYTDNHPLLLQMKKEIAPQFGKWSGVVSDVFFDYILANHFETFYPKNLGTFVAEKHQVIRQHFDLVPLKMQPMAKAMIDYNWLLNYRTIKGIEETFTNLSRRNEMRKELFGAEKSLRTNLAYYEEYFFAFYPQLQQVSIDFLKSS